MTRKIAFGASALALAAALSFAALPSAHAGDKDQWLHVAVDGPGERVRVNVPLSVVETVLPLIEDEEFNHGRIRIDDADLSAQQIRAILTAVRDAEDGVYVTVEDRGETVRVAKEGEYLLVDISEEWRSHTERVNVRVPVAVLDALVQGEGDELNLMAAVRALGEHGAGDLVSVDDDGTQVRIWIDDTNMPEEEEI